MREKKSRKSCEKRINNIEKRKRGKWRQKLICPLVSGWSLVAQSHLESVRLHLHFLFPENGGDVAFILEKYKKCYSKERKNQTSKLVGRLTKNVHFERVFPRRKWESIKKQFFFTTLIFTCNFNNFCNNETKTTTTFPWNHLSIISFIGFWGRREINIYCENLGQVNNITFHTWNLQF